MTMMTMMTIENWNIEEMTGYKPVTSFYMDFSFADMFGLDSIKDTFDRAFKEWKHNYIYITELAMVLNWKIWRWYDEKYEYAALYDKLWREVDEWCMDNLKGDELNYYIETTD